MNPRVQTRRLAGRLTLALGLCGALLGAAPASAAAAQPLSVCFLYSNPIGESGWTYQQELARRELASAMGDKITTKYVENIAEGPDAERVIRNFVQEGCKLIFTPSFGFMEPTVKVVTAMAPIASAEPATFAAPIGKPPGPLRSGSSPPATAEPSLPAIKSTSALPIIGPTLALAMLPTMASVIAWPGLFALHATTSANACIVFSTVGARRSNAGSTRSAMLAVMASSLF